MNKLVQAWYQGSAWLSLLKPLSTLYRRQVRIRRAGYQNGSKPSWRAPVPVVVVGNITVGGVGKTPLVAWLAKRLIEQGYKPGIVSRGYGSNAPYYPFEVKPESKAQQSGDEPLMFAISTGCPVVIDANRVAAAQHLLSNYQCDLILSDDGMQHYALQRDIEVAVVDGQRGLGNGLCLPAGPLREPPERLGSVNFIVVNEGGFEPPYKSYEMKLMPSELVNLVKGESLRPDALVNEQVVHAVAGIGNPARFFKTLSSLGYRIKEQAFSDHHAFTQKDLQFNDDAPVIMTEKDAVKCSEFANEHCWYLRVIPQLSSDFEEALNQKLLSIKQCTELNN